MNAAQKESALVTLKAELEKASSLNTDERLVVRLTEAIQKLEAIEPVEDGSDSEE